MSAPDFLPTNPNDLAARREHDALRIKALTAYEGFLISRARGIRSAVEPARMCWERAQKQYLLTCPPMERAASGSPESPGAAPEDPDWFAALASDIEGVRQAATSRLMALEDQTRRLEEATRQNTDKLMQFMRYADDWHLPKVTSQEVRQH